VDIPVVVEHHRVATEVEHLGQHAPEACARERAGSDRELSHREFGM
jgi:hypothetical protein